MSDLPKSLAPVAIQYSQLLNYIEYWERQGYSSKQILQMIKDNCVYHQKGETKCNSQ